MRFLVDATVLQYPFSGIAKATLGLYSACRDLDPATQVVLVHRAALSMPAPFPTVSVRLGVFLSDATYSGVSQPLPMVDEPFFLFFGQFDPRKRLEPAFAAVRERWQTHGLRIPLVVVGKVLRLLATNPRHRQDLIVAGRTQADRFSWRRAPETYFSALEPIVRRRSSRSTTL